MPLDFDDVVEPPCGDASWQLAIATSIGWREVALVLWRCDAASNGNQVALRRQSHAADRGTSAAAPALGKRLVLVGRCASIDSGDRAGNDGPGLDVAVGG